MQFCADLRTKRFVISAVKKDTEAIHDDTSAIRDDTAQIPEIKQDTSQIASLVQEMGFLRLQISDLERYGGGGGVAMERFLAESASYAESVVDTSDLETLRATNEDKVAELTKYDKNSGRSADEADSRIESSPSIPPAPQPRHVQAQNAKLSPSAQSVPMRPPPLQRQTNQENSTIGPAFTPKAPAQRLPIPYAI